MGQSWEQPAFLSCSAHCTVQARWQRTRRQMPVSMTVMPGLT